MPKLMPKFDVKKKIKTLNFIDFGWIFWPFRGVRGVAQFKLRLQADFNLGFTRPAPQAGVRRIKNQSKIDAKSMQEKGMQKVWKMMPKCI